MNHGFWIWDWFMHAWHDWQQLAEFWVERIFAVILSICIVSILQIVEPFSIGTPHIILSEVDVLCALFLDHVRWLDQKQNTWNIYLRTDDQQCSMSREGLLNLGCYFLLQKFRYTEGWASHGPARPLSLRQGGHDGTFGVKMNNLNFKAPPWVCQQKKK